jgi:lysine 2,3-aminomutase
MAVRARPYAEIPLWRGVPPDAWEDWRWQARNAVTRLEDLRQILRLTADEEAGLAATGDEFRMAISPYYCTLMDPEDPTCPVRMMAVPRAAEAIRMPGELRDPLAEDSHTPVPRLVHRYPDRVLLLANNLCTVYCRFCTRKRLTGEDNETITPGELGAVAGYLRDHPEVRDVLVSGGDPWVMSDRRLEEILRALRAVPSVEIIRFGTRAPVVLPQRVTDSLVRMLRRYQPIWVMTHFNHPKELTPDAERACARIVDAGIPLCNQAVLLRRVNSSARIVKDLFQRLARWRVHAYYLHQCDLAQGLEAFRTPLEVGVRILEELRGHTSGYVVPTFAVDLPGGGGKVPLGPDYLVARSRTEAVFRNWAGDTYRYPDVAGVDCSCPYEEKWYAAEKAPPMGLSPPPRTDLAALRRRAS